MTTPNAFLFLLLGLVMFFLPSVWPEHFLPQGLGSASTSALWLRCMAFVHAGFGGWHVLHHEFLPRWQKTGAWQVVLEQEPEAVLAPVSI